MWTILTPVIFALATRFRLHRRGWQGAAALHFLAAIPVSFVHLTLTARGSVIESLSHRVRLFVEIHLALNVLTYFIDHPSFVSRPARAMVTGSVQLPGSIAALRAS